MTKKAKEEDCRSRLSHIWHLHFLLIITQSTAIGQCVEKLGDGEVAAENLSRSSPVLV